jgi:hypothetical protein
MNDAERRALSERHAQRVAKEKARPLTISIWVANAASGVVHSEDCEYAVSMMEPVLFEELHHALASGFREAACCLSDRPYAMYRAAHKVREQIKQRTADAGCCICGESRVVDRAHVVPRAAGGRMTMPLCPTHHRAYDEGRLSGGELSRLAEKRGEIVRKMHGEVARCR